eukprot:g9427.t1
MYDLVLSSSLLWRSRWQQSLLVLVCSFAGGAVGQLRILDAEADIRDLDVGDMDDYTSDLAASVREEIKRLKSQADFLRSDKKTDGEDSGAAGRSPSSPAKGEANSKRSKKKRTSKRSASEGKTSSSKKTRKNKKRSEKTKPADNYDPLDLVRGLGGGGKQTMSFAILNLDYAIEQDKKTGHGSHELAQQWQSLLETDGKQAKFYAVDPDRILIVTNTAADLVTVRDFVLSEQNAGLVDYYEANQQKWFPRGRKRELVGDEKRRKRSDELRWGERYGTVPTGKAKVTKPVVDESPSKKGGKETGKKAKKAKYKKPVEGAQDDGEL